MSLVQRFRALNPVIQTVAALVTFAGFGLAIVGGTVGFTGGSTPGPPAVTMSPTEGVWDSNTYGSHWHAIIGWATSGQVKSCSLRDDHGTGPVTVDPTNASYPFGSYTSSVEKVQVVVSCKGPGGTGQGYTNVQRAAAPPVTITIEQVARVWIDAQQTHWGVYITWRSDGVGCWISDDVNKRLLYKDPRGETRGPYGNFDRTVLGTTLHFKCIDVANVPFFKDRGVLRPRLTRA